MLKKILPATAVLLSLITAPAFGDDENVDCFYEAHASHPACSKGANAGEASFSSIEFVDERPAAAAVDKQAQGLTSTDRQTFTATGTHK